MTPKQATEFNRMRAALLHISKGYCTVQQLRRNAVREYGLSPEEAIEYAYENIQQTAKNAVSGVREVKL